MLKLSEDGKWYRVSLRLMGDGLPIKEIEEKMGLAPSSSGIKGEHLNGNIRHSKFLTNIWVLRSGTDSDVPFDKQISILLDLL